MRRALAVFLCLGGSVLFLWAALVLAGLNSPLSAFNVSRQHAMAFGGTLFFGLASFALTYLEDDAVSPATRRATRLVQWWALGLVIAPFGVLVLVLLATLGARVL